MNSLSGTNLATEAARFAPLCRCMDSRREAARNAALAEQYDSVQTQFTGSRVESSFSGDACQLLSATVRDYLENGRAVENIAEATAGLCREAHARGLTAEETLGHIRSALGGILAARSLPSSDRAALVALAIDQCVHAYYHEHR